MQWSHSELKFLFLFVAWRSNESPCWAPGIRCLWFDARCRDRRGRNFIHLEDFGEVLVQRIGLVCLAAA